MPLSDTEISDMIKQHAECSGLSGIGIVKKFLQKERSSLTVTILYLVNAYKKSADIARIILKTFCILR